MSSFGNGRYSPFNGLYRGARGIERACIACMNFEIVSGGYNELLMLQWMH